MGQPNYKNGFAVTLHENMLEVPLKWKQPRTIFVNSMSDLFHKDVPDEFIRRVFDIMSRAFWHRFQMLTKRSKQLIDLNADISWPGNVWMGVSVENEDYVSRISDLRKTAARVKFLSLEPLLGPLKRLPLQSIDWVIVGGESGPGARPIESTWVLDIRNQCRDRGVPFFFKQWGGINKKRTGRLLEGRTWDEMPAAATIGPVPREQTASPLSLPGW
jgi:protein gp37